MITIFFLYFQFLVYHEVTWDKSIKNSKISFIVIKFFILLNIFYFFDFFYILGIITLNKKKYIKTKNQNYFCFMQRSFIINKSINQNPGHNILVQIQFTTSKRKLDIQYSKLNIRVASRFAERLNLGNQEILVKSQIWVDTQSSVQSPFENLHFANKS